VAAIKVYREGNRFIVDEGGANVYHIQVNQLEIIETSATTLRIIYDPIGSSTNKWDGLITEVQNKDGVAYGTTMNDINENIVTGIDVNIQDQHTPSVDTYFLQQTANFTLSADTPISTVTTLEYDLEATAGHGLIVGNEILLLETDGDRSFYAEVKNVVTNTITLDRPIDFVYTAASTLGRIVSSEMAVDGSVTPQIFTIRGGALVAHDITRLFLTMLSGSSMDDGKFGSLTALTNGVVLRIIDGYQENILNLKTNNDIKQFCYDLKYSSKAAAGTYGLSSRMSFGGQSMHGVTIRVKGTDALQWIVQDDLTGLVSLKASAQGHHVE